MTSCTSNSKVGTNGHSFFLYCINLNRNRSTIFFHLTPFQLHSRIPWLRQHVNKTYTYHLPIWYELNYTTSKIKANATLKITWELYLSHYTLLTHEVSCVSSPSWSSVLIMLNSKIYTDFSLYLKWGTLTFSNLCNLSSIYLLSYHKLCDFLIQYFSVHGYVILSKLLELCIT